MDVPERVENLDVFLDPTMTVGDVIRKRWNRTSFTWRPPIPLLPIFVSLSLLYVSVPYTTILDVVDKTQLN